MTILVSGATAVTRLHPEIGTLVVPGAGNDPSALPLDRVWAMDNGAFSGLDVPAFLAMLRRFKPYDASHTYQRCCFVTAPDVVANAELTLEAFREWEPFIHSLGWRVAFVGQDGLHIRDVPWDSCEAVFLGGSTDWKLGPVAADLASYGKARGKWVHMGRVNSIRRIRYAERIGCDSIDGTSFSRWSKLYIPRGLDVIAAAKAQARLW